MVRFPRIGNRGSKIALYTGFTTLIAINGYIAVKALAGDPVKLQGFETKELGRETFRQSMQGELVSYEDVKKRLIEKKKKKVVEQRQAQSDLDLEQMSKRTRLALWSTQNDGTDRNSDSDNDNGDGDDDNDWFDERDDERTLNRKIESRVSTLDEEMNRMNQLFEVKIKQLPSSSSPSRPSSAPTGK